MSLAHLDYNLDGEMSYTNMKRDLSNQGFYLNYFHQI